jgi:hypothetical protein
MDGAVIPAAIRREAKNGDSREQISKYTFEIVR